MYFCIDTSYTIFYRFHALQTWAGLALKDSSETETERAIQAKFREKYLETMLNICKKIYIESRKSEIEKEGEEEVREEEGRGEGRDEGRGEGRALKKKAKKIKFNQEEHTFLWCRDTDRSTLWRTELFPEYKGNRQNDTGVGSFFSDTYQNILGPFIEANPNHHLLRLERLEADDMIYLTCKYLVETRRGEDYTNIAIVTSDYDLLQIKKLESPKHSINFWKCQKGGSLWTSKSDDPDFDLFCKIIGGDPSDNIKSCFKGVGKKTIQKLFKDQSLFDTHLAKSEEGKNQYLLNKTLIDFRNIPEHYQLSALAQIKSVLER